MKKRVMSLALALSMVFGTSSYFEQSAVIEAAQITASAAAVPASLTYKKQYESDFSKHPEYIIITGYTGSLTELVIPDQIDGLPVVEISASAFKNAPNLKKITLPKKLVSCKNAFADCKKLETVVIPEGIFKLDDAAFKNCPKLKTIKLPSTIEYIGYSAFEGCTSLASVYIPSKVICINSDTFARSGLKSISLPSSVKTISESAFSDCTSLASVTLAKGLETIGSKAFYKCTSLKSITIPQGTTTIDEGAFDGCTALSSVSLPSTITKMEHCFDDVPWYTAQAKKSRESHSGLVIINNVVYDASSYTRTSLALPTTTKYISSYAGFKSTLKSLTLNEGLAGIGTGALTNTDISRLYLPSTLNDMDPEGMFPTKTIVTISSANKSFTVDDNILYNKDKTILYHCPSDNAPTKALPKGLKKIAASAFEDNTKLTALTLPVTIKSVGTHAFYNCTALKRLTVPAGNIYLGSFAFGYNKSYPGAVKNSSFTCCVYGGSYAKRYCEIDNIPTKELAACSHKTTADLTEKDKIDSCNTNVFVNTVCTSCGKVIKETSSNEKTHSPLKTHVFDSYCEKHGHNISVCLSCAEVSWDSTEPAGHKFSSPAVTVQMPGKTTGSAVSSKSCTVCGKKSERLVSIDRIYGANRYKTAVGISSYYPSSEFVVLAQGMEFADALAGVPFAQNIGAPILLTGKDSVPSEVLGEIKRLKAKKVYILGGENAISQKAVDSIIALGINKNNVIRLQGETRFGTAAAIASRNGGIPKEIFFVYGFDFADALSVSPIAARRKAPIIYLRKDGQIDSETMKYLSSVKGHITAAYVIGGTAVVSDSMLKKAAQAVGLQTARRLSGANRYETCIDVNTGFKNVFSGNTICVATGKSFPDALAGGVFAADALSPMFLADTVLSDKQKEFLNNISPRSMYILGGKNAVPDDLGKKIALSLI